MRTVAEIQVVPQGTLWVDILADPPGLSIRRQGGGLVRVQRNEIGDLMQTLALAALELVTLETKADEAED